MIALSTRRGVVGSDSASQCDDVTSSIEETSAISRRITQSSDHGGLDMALTDADVQLERAVKSSRPLYSPLAF